MTDFDDPSPPASRWATWLKAAVCVAVFSLLAAAFWFRWIPGRPVPPEWARGGASPDNSLSYETEEDLPSSIAGDLDAVSASRFLFTMGEGSGLHGFDVIQVWPTGRCEYTYPDPRPTGGLPGTTGPSTAPIVNLTDLAPFRRATFSVSPQVVADLRRLLVEVDYFNMKRAYRAPIEDGTQWFVRVQAGSHEKSVWCDNHFPRQIMKVNDFIRTEIVEPNATARGLAAPVNLPMNWLPELGFSRSAPDEGATED